METSKKLTGQQLSDLTLFAVDTLANPLVPQENETAQQTLDTCGLQCTTPFANYDPDTHSWKTYGAICLWGLETYSQTWPKSGMTQNGKSYQQQPLVRYTKETGYSLWPTPTAVVRPMEGNVRLYRAKIAAGEMTETEANAMLGKSVWEAQGKIPAMWPTPRASAAMSENLDNVKKRVQRRGFLGSKLEETVAMWPTPRAAQAESRNHTVYARSLDKPQNLENKIATVEPSAIGGKLNPTWVEWLMGFPIGWTDLED